MPVTIREIARELELSESTVSRILSGAPGHRVSDSTRARVLEAAQRLNFSPNALARSLRGGNTNVIGFYDTWASDGFNAGHEFLGRIIGGLQNACARAGCDLLLHSPIKGRRTDQIYGELRNGRIDGLIIHGDYGDPLLQRLVDGDLPLVTIIDNVANVPSVTIDDWDGVRQVVEYLWARKYRRFAWIGPQQIGGGPMQRGWDFCGMLYERGVKEVPMFSMETDTDTPPPLDELLQMQSAVPNEPVAVGCWNDYAAYNLLRECQKRGVRVPQQLAVVGFDGFIDIKLPAMHLVTVGCPWDEMAQTAVRLLMQRLDSVPVPLQTALKPTLLEGDTA